MRALWIVLLLGLVGKVAGQQPGELDLSFDGDGMMVLDTIRSYSFVACALAENGQILVVFNQPDVGGMHPIVMKRFNEDGSADPAFGTNGIVNLGSEFFFGGGFLLPTGDSSVVVIYGSTITRLRYDGTVDQTYGQGGRAQLDSLGWGQFRYVTGAKHTPDNRLVITANFYLNGTETSRVLRLTSNGQMDPTFGNGGGGPSSEWISFEDISIGPDGTIALARFHPATCGACAPTQSRMYLDANGASPSQCISSPWQYQFAYGVGAISTNAYGMTITSASSIWPYFSCDSDGLCGHAPFYPGEMGLSANDPLDNDASGNFHFGTAASWEDSPGGWALQRRLPNGQYDESFGEFGGFTSATVFQTGEPAIPTSLIELPNGKVLLAGRGKVQGIDRLLLARYHNIPDPRSMLSLRMFLGGAYDPGTGLMRDDLREQGLVPTLQPYGPPFFSMANGVGTWAAPQSVLQVEGDSAVVDWVWLDLLDAADTATVRATRVGLVHRNGWVTSADGRSPIDFSAGAGSYFVRARHRNHLGATASVPVSLGTWQTTLDLTDPAAPTFGTEAQKVVNGVAMLWPGEVRADGVVKFLGTRNDRDPILLAVGGNTPTNVVTGYRSEDLNLDGWVKYIGTANDRDIILQTIGGGEPTGVRVQQGP